MPTPRLRRSTLLAILMATTMVASDASAQGLFGRIFGQSPAGSRMDGGNPHAPARGLRRMQQPMEALPPLIAAPAAPAVPIVKVTGPSYYTYKAPALVRIDFTKLMPVDGAEITGSTTIKPAVPFADALNGLSDFDYLAEKEIAAAIETHYAAHPEFIWVEDGAVSARAEAALKVLGEADQYGLDGADYGVFVPGGNVASVERKAVMPVSSVPSPFPLDGMSDVPPDLGGGQGAVQSATAADTQSLIRFEMALSARVLRYMRDANGGRINPNKISGYHDFPAKALDLAALLGQLESAPDAATLMLAQHPKGVEYELLVRELAALKTSAENDITVDPKLLLKPGQTSAELPKLLQLIAQKADLAFKEKHQAVLVSNTTAQTYGPELEPVIRDAQSAHGLKADGVVGPRTVAAIAGVSKADRLNKVVVALEQLRWHPSELGATRVFLNAAAFTATYREDGVDMLSMRTVVGKPQNQTSFFYDEIEQVDYNPYWGVPRSIIVNEMLPRLRSDPGYLDRAGYEVTDASGQRVPSASINWSAVGANVPYGVRQTPSEANALGELKILFPNKHAIYMHDTPQKDLFARDGRAFSHGCVRLADPRGMASAVLGKPTSHIEAKLAAGHSSEKVSRKIPVYVAYFTAWPDASGQITYVPDVYDRDSHVLTAMSKTSAVRSPAM